MKWISVFTFSLISLLPLKALEMETVTVTPQQMPQIPTQELVQFMLVSAQQGDRGGMYNLGRFYAQGLGVEKSWKKAAEWYRRAAEKGLPEAMFCLSECYENGWGVEKSENRAVVLLKQSAEGGFVLAQFNLAIAYESGKYGFAVQLPEAAKWYRKAALQKFPQAQYRMYYLCLHGKGVPESAKQAAGWLRLAAGGGLAEAQYELGCAYLIGKLFEQSVSDAVHYLRLAAAQGHADAQYVLDQLPQ
jgi:TPR repeat protein